MELSLLEAVFDQDYKPPNQKTAKGFFATLLEVPPGTERGAYFLLSALSYTARNGLHTTYPLLWDAVTDVMDKALERSCLSFKGSRLSPTLWYENHEEYIGLVVHRDAHPQVHPQPHAMARC